MDKIEKVAALRKKAVELKLENAGILDKYTDEQLSDIYNGIGPEAFPEMLRSLLDSLNPTLEPCALIHDVEWHESDGTEASWEASNKRFDTNGRILANAEYGWWNPYRYIVRHRAGVFADACGTSVGWAGWLACHEQVS